MSYRRLVILTALTMVAFAGNSLLCRMALDQTSIDAATFTTIRLVSGALVLWLISSFFCKTHAGSGRWSSALALFVYAAGFSFAYVSLTAATGALLLFGAVQATMILYGIWSGERLGKPQICGLVIALGGLIGLLLPGFSAPPLGAALLMLFSGLAWGIYSLNLKGAGNPVRVTTGNFSRALLFTVFFALLPELSFEIDLAGVWYAIASGALASGLGYVLWYSVLPEIKAVTAATIQLSVPVVTAAGGILFLGESVTVRFVMASLAILGGIGLVLLSQRIPADQVVELTDRQK